MVGRIGGIIVDFGTSGDRDTFLEMNCGVAGVGDVIGESVGNRCVVGVEGVE